MVSTDVEPQAGLGRPGQLVKIAPSEVEVPLARIRRDLGAVDQLAESLDTYGLMHPIQVYVSHGRYRLIAGERRLKAALSLGWTTIDARINDPRDDELLLELIENTQRKHLSDAEEADALIQLVRVEGYEVKYVAAQVGRSEAYVSKRVRVFQDAVLRGFIEQGVLTVSLAEEFLAVPAELRPELVLRAVAERWDVPYARTAIREAMESPAADAETSSEEAAARGRESADEAATARESVSDLARHVRELAKMLRDVRPYELRRADERALAELLSVLLRLARAHAGAAGRNGPVFPSLVDAERVARTSRRR